MNIYEFILIMIIFLIFPFCVELIYQVTYQNINQKRNEYSYLLAVLTAFYFLVRFGINKNPLVVTLFLNVLFLFVSQKKQLTLECSLAILLIAVGTIYTPVPWYMWILFYTLIFVNKDIYYKLNYSKSIYLLLFDGILLTSIFFYPLDQPFLYYGIIILSFVTLSFTVDLLDKYGQNAISFHRTLKDLEEEKQLRMSLFQITHEIKNPITVCKGYLDMFDVDNKDHAKRYVPILKEEIARVLVLIEDFLQITKIKIDKDWMDATLLLEENKRNFELLFKKNNIKCTFDIPDDEIYIYADYQRLNQVLINLIKNSMEALEENKNMEVKLNVKKQQLEIVVKDYGKGMSKEQLSKIKTPFYTTKQSGTGLGLYLSDEIIKAHQGSILYHSKLNQGTTVQVLLPYKKDAKIS